jgi:hypothetical protein
MIRPVTEMRRGNRGRHASRGNGGTSSQLNVRRGKPGLRFGLAAAVAVFVVFAIGAWLAGPKSDHGPSQVAAPAAAPVPVSVPTSATIKGQRATGQDQGMVGQIFGIGGRCLAGSNGGDANGTPVILATCTGTENQQEWTLLPNDEIVLNDRCLGVNPKDSQTTSLVGLYACNQTAPEMWSVQDNHTIRSLRLGLCLGSWRNKDINGNLVWVTACQSNAKAQSWTLPSPAVDPSGLAMPVGNVPGWQQAFTDDFTENVPVGEFPAEVSNKWGDYLDGWPDSTHIGTYEPTKVVSIHDGMMNLFLHTADGIHMVAAPLPKIPGATGTAGGTVYGMYEIRFKAQQVAGYKTSWLLWPDSNNQAQGEIDFPEGFLEGNIRAYMHYVGPNPKAQDAYPTPYTYAGWHTATTIWTANSVIFMLDGKVIGDSTDKSVIPDTPMHWVLQTETRTSGGPPSNAATANVEIDWVSAWLPQRS